MLPHPLAPNAAQNFLAAASHQLDSSLALPATHAARSLAGQLQEGIRLYERALALRPRHPDALYNLGVAYTEAGQIDKALFM